TYKTLYDPQGANQYGNELNDINNSGVMVGNWVSADSQGLAVPHGFIYKNGVFKNIVYPGALATSASGINNYGTVVGTARMPANNGFGYNVVPYKAYCKITAPEVFRAAGAGQITSGGSDSVKAQSPHRRDATSLEGEFSAELSAPIAEISAAA